VIVWLCRAAHIVTANEANYVSGDPELEYRRRT